MPAACACSRRSSMVSVEWEPCSISSAADVDERDAARSEHAPHLPHGVALAVVVQAIEHVERRRDVDARVGERELRHRASDKPPARARGRCEGRPATVRRRPTVRTPRASRGCVRCPRRNRRCAQARGRRAPSSSSSGALRRSPRNQKCRSSAARSLRASAPSACDCTSVRAARMTSLRPRIDAAVDFVDRYTYRAR